MEIGELGTAVISVELLEDFRTLWEGDTDPSVMENIEVVLRAFLTHERLVVLDRIKPENYFVGAEEDGRENPLASSRFGGDVLAYDFDGVMRANDADPSKDELTAFVAGRARLELLRALPEEVRSSRAFHSYILDWLRDYPIHQSLSDDTLIDEKGWTRERPLSTPLLADFTNSALQCSVSGFVDLHRRRASVYGAGRVFDCFDKCLQSDWPEHLFEKFGESFREEAELLRAPGDPLALPPFVLLVMARAQRRSSIPETISELRQELAEDRKDLWRRIGRLVSATTLEEQRGAVAELRLAREHLFEASGGTRLRPDRIPGSTSLLIDASGLRPSGVLRGLAERDRPKAAVSRVGFAKRLAGLMRSLQTSATVMRRHLEPSERRAFGMDR